MDRNGWLFSSTKTGGGGLSHYCFDFVSVAPASVVDGAADQDEYRIYSGSCHTLGFLSSDGRSPVLENAPLLNWRSDSVPEVTFDPTAAAEGTRR